MIEAERTIRSARITDRQALADLPDAMDLFGPELSGTLVIDSDDPEGTARALQAAVLEGLGLDGGQGFLNAVPVAIHLLSRKEGKVIKVGSLRHLRETTTRQFRSLKPNEGEGGAWEAEVTATDFDGIMAEGRTLAQIHDNVVVKVPLILDGIKAIKTLSEEGIRTNCTLCFSATQALIAAKAGATYISPFIGRIDDISWNGMDLIRSIVEIYDNYELETEVLAASIRHPLHVKEAAEIGADVATMPLDVIKKLLEHPLTDLGLDKFLADWEDLQAQFADEG